MNILDGYGQDPVNEQREKQTQYLDFLDDEVVFFII